MKHAHTALVALALLAPVLPGCSSSEPAVSGLPIFDSRTVRVGETVTVTLPSDPERGTRWRITSFDSLRLRPDAPAQRVVRNGHAETVLQFRAAAPGETEVTMQQEGTGTPQRRTITINILE